MISPAPWKIDWEYFAIRDANGDLVCHFARRSNEGEHKANAELIVSAANSEKKE